MGDPNPRQRLSAKSCVREWVAALFCPASRAFSACARKGFERVTLRLGMPKHTNRAQIERVSPHEGCCTIRLSAPSMPDRLVWRKSPKGTRQGKAHHRRDALHSGCCEKGGCAAPNRRAHPQVVTSQQWVAEKREASFGKVGEQLGNGTRGVALTPSGFASLNWGRPSGPPRGAPQAVNLMISGGAGFLVLLAVDQRGLAFVRLAQAGVAIDRPPARWARHAAAGPLHGGRILPLPRRRPQRRG